MLKTLYKLFLNSCGISIDTRTLQENQIYFALKGDNFDGNKYAAQALENGALCVVVDDASVLINKQDKPYFLVSDVLDTLQRLAKYHREILDIPIVGITGTNGKTTTKELCNAVLASEKNVYATKGNFNNHIGVPLSLLSITDEHDLAIIEMGANHQGEIKTLCEIAKPNIGIITNIGVAHLEGFGSEDVILKTKKELFDFIEDIDGTFLYPEQDSKIHSFAKYYDKSKAYSNSVSNAFLNYSSNNESIFSTLIIDEKSIVSQLFGQYNVQNMAAAYALGQYLDYKKTNITQALEEYKPQNNRSQVVKTKHNDLIIDAYNANPTSLGLAVNQFQEINNPNKVIIIGDMFELGDREGEEHQKIIDGLEADSDKFDLALVVGKAFSLTQFVGGNKIMAFENRLKLEQYLKENPLKGKSILLKASRGIGLEKVVDLL